MEVRVAKTAGFCFGVKRAVDTVTRLSETAETPVYTYGPIIHNEDVVQKLERQGVRILHTMEEVLALSEGTVVIRSHGVPKEIYERMLLRQQETGGAVTVVDATCPFVKKIHNIVSRESAAGKRIVICGDAAHPEIRGIVGWCQNGAQVIDSCEEAERFASENREPFCVVAQTTYNYKKFNDIVEILSKMSYYRDDSVVNTICNATEERQAEAQELARSCDAMIIIGGMNSSNTRKLFELSRQLCEKTFYVQAADNLELDVFHSFRSVGITAGASTPRNIIEEVHKSMADMSFEQLLEESFKTIHNGEVVSGTVIRVKEDEIVLNIGYKADGVITRSEYTSKNNVDLREVVKEGSTLEAKVIKVNDGEGQVLLSCRRLIGERASQMLTEAYENKTVLKAPVASVEAQGLIVVLDETRIFIPASMVSDTYEKDLSKYKDQEIEFLLVEYDVKSRKKRIIGDRKQLLIAQKKAKMEELLSRVQVGDVIDGVVKNVADFGVFVDIGGVDGLLHISEMSWGRIENPKKLFKSGDKVTVFIKDIKGEKIALSMKFADQNPWANAEERYAIGTVVTGTVARMTSFGAFVELAPGVDALLHVSQISHKRVEKPADALSIGQEIEAVIVDFKPEERKISLSMKALEAAPAKEEPAAEDEEA